MGGIDKRDMLIHLYCTPLKSKRWYTQLFPYAIDVSLANAWVIYRRDWKALDVVSLSLKNFRLQVFKDASSQKPVTSFIKRYRSLHVEACYSATLGMGLCLH